MNQQRPASMEDVARAAAVSTATVSRVINTPDLVAPDTAARVQKAIEQLGYKPNVFAQGLMTRKSRLLGIVLPDIRGEFYAELLRGADEEARRHGFHLIISTEGRESETPLFSSNMVGFIAGLALMLTEPNEALWRQASSADVPLVVIDEDIGGDAADRVLVDNAAGTREAAEHLLALAPPDRCFFVGGPKENFDTAERARAFLAALKERGGKPSPEQAQFGEYSVEWGSRAARQIIPLCAAGPVGVLCGNDEIAFGLLLAARDAGVDVPGRLRVIGFDDTRLATLVRPQLSTVRVPTAEVGAAAVSALIRRLSEPESPRTTVKLPTRLVVRGSSNPPAA